MTDQVKWKDGTISLTELTDIRVFVSNHLSNDWIQRSEPVYLYHNDHARLRVVLEEHPGFEGLTRAATLAVLSINSTELDGDILGKTFVDDVCQHLSVYDMRSIHSHLTAFLDQWDATREQ